MNHGHPRKLALYALNTHIHQVFIHSTHLAGTLLRYSSKRPLTAGSVLIIVFRIHTSSAAFSLRTLYLSRYSRSDKRTMIEIHEESQGEGMKRKRLKRTASDRRSVPRTPIAHQIASPDLSPIHIRRGPHGPYQYASALIAPA